jgi:hypothetical protein
VRRWLEGVGWAAVPAVLVLAGPAQAQESPREVRFAVNYVYAAQLGFGGYRVGGLNVRLYSLPIAFKIDDVLGDWDLQVAMPIQYGDYDVSARLDDGSRVKGTSHTLAVEPKLKLEIPVVPRVWRISLIGAWGFGSTFSSSARVVDGSGARTPVPVDESGFYTYQIAASSLLEHRVGKWTFGLGNSFGYAGNSSLEGDPSVEGYGEISAGVEARHPLGFEAWSAVPDASLFFIYDFFTPRLQFTRVSRDDLEVQNLYEVGVTFGSETPLDVPLLHDLRIGASYQFGSDLDAVRLSFGFPF